MSNEETETVKQTPIEIAQAQVITLSQHNDALNERLRTALEENARLREQAMRDKHEIEQLRETTRLDALTGLGNRRAFDDALSRYAARSGHGGKGRVVPFVLLILDVDDLKTWNGNGHPVGDQVLREVGDAIYRSLRPQDRAFRFGGDEFAIILHDVSPDVALMVAERLQRRLKRVQVLDRSPTVSIGGSCICSPRNEAEIYDAADQNAIAAKRFKGTATPAIIITNGNTTSPSPA